MLFLIQGKTTRKPPTTSKRAKALAVSKQGAPIRRYDIILIRFLQPPLLYYDVCVTLTCVWVQIEQETYGDACQEHDGPFHDDGTHPPRHATLRPEVNVSGRLS